MKRHLFTLLAGLALFAEHAPAQTVPYDECGALVQGVTCPLLFADGQGRVWLLDQTGGFGLGAQLRVVGLADPFCFTACQQGGCIAVSSIGPCSGSAGIEYCFGDGSGTACPCSNNGTAGHGCGHAASTLGAHLSATGSASIMNDTLVLTSTHGVPFGPGLYFQGDTPVVSGSPFGNGLLCLGGATNRLEIRFADSVGSSATTVAIHTLGATAAGDVRYYQLWFRDGVGFCTGSGFNLANAVQLTWTP